MGCTHGKIEKTLNTNKTNKTPSEADVDLLVPFVEAFPLVDVPARAPENKPEPTLVRAFETEPESELSDSLLRVESFDALLKLTPIQASPFLPASYIQLNPEKILTAETSVRSFAAKKTFKERPLSDLQGLYAFLLVQGQFEGKTVQYLMIKSMKYYPADETNSEIEQKGIFESDHGALKGYIKKISGYNDSFKHIVGGEIRFKAENITWNVRSAGYSRDTPYNYERNIEGFEERLAELWIPGAYAGKGISRRVPQKNVLNDVSEALDQHLNSDSNDIDEQSQSVTFSSTTKRTHPIYAWGSNSVSSRHRFFSHVNSTAISCSSSQNVGADTVFSQV